MPTCPCAGSGTRTGDTGGIQTAPSSKASWERGADFQFANYERENIKAPLQKGERERNRAHFPHSSALLYLSVGGENWQLLWEMHR